MLKLDAEDSRAPYVQIADAIREEIVSGTYAAGEKLPAGKLLADRYGVAVNTVRSALDLLRQEGLIATRHGQGSFVLDAKAPEASESPDVPAAELAAIHGQLAEINRRLAAIEEKLGADGH